MISSNEASAAKPIAIAQLASKRRGPPSKNAMITDARGDA
jgi:hypothetical protein